MKEYFYRVLVLGRRFIGKLISHYKEPDFIIKKLFLFSKTITKTIMRRIVIKLFFYISKIKNYILRIKNYILRIKNKLNQYAVNTSNTLSNKLKYTKNHVKSLIDEDAIFSKNSTAIVEILKAGDPVKVVNYLSDKYKFFSFPSIKFLIRLYKYASIVETTKYKFWDTNNSKEKVMIHFCCWGESYSSKVTNYLLPSLLARNNLPALAEKYNLSILIHCDTATKKRIIQSDAYSKLEMYSSVIFCVFPKKLIRLYNSKTGKIGSIFPQIRYFLLGVCQTHAFKAALKHRAYLSYLMPDVVLSESFFKNAFTNIKDKKIVLTTTYRSNYQSAYPHLDNFYKNSTEQGLLCISANELLELQISHIHPCEKKRIVSIKTNNFSPSARLIFKNKNGFIFRCFHYHPVIINCDNVNKTVYLDYLPIDNTALNEVLESDVSYHDQVWVCTDPSQMAIMELSDETPEMEVVVNLTTLNYEQLVSQVQDLLKNAPTIFNTPFNQFLASFRHLFTVPGYVNPLAFDDEIIDDTTFFNDVIHPVEVKNHALTG